MRNCRLPKVHFPDGHCKACGIILSDSEKESGLCDICTLKLNTGHIYDTQLEGDRREGSWMNSQYTPGGFTW